MPRSITAIEKAGPIRGPPGAEGLHLSAEQEYAGLETLGLFGLFSEVRSQTPEPVVAGGGLLRAQMEPGSQLMLRAADAATLKQLSAGK